MKKLLLIVATIVFIGNITGQRQKEELVPLSSSTSRGYSNSVSTGSYSKTTCCLCVITTEVNVNTNYLMDHMFMNTYKSTDILIGGIPENYGDIKENPIEEETIPITTYTLKDYNHNGKYIISPIRITKEVLKAIPVTLSEDDISQALLLMGCPKETMNVETSESSEISEEEQGPFTGLEGHNFIEHPAIIYPNPVKDILQVKSTDPITVIEILGITGQLEMSLDTRSTMDVSTLAAGTYYVRIHFENIKDVQVEKIIVVK